MVTHSTRLAAETNRLRRAVDDVRIREHLRRAERALRRADHDLAPAERARRERALDRLRDYRRAGEFPTNEGAERTPRFVGANGVPCAVGHLLLSDGRADLVREIAAEENAVRIEDLEDGPLLAWLDSNGLTQAEAARVQPSYPHAVRFATDCGPLACGAAGALASLVGLAIAATLEYAGYRLVGGWFPENALKRRSALAYLTAFNLLLAPFAAALVYALFP